MQRNGEAEREEDEGAGGEKEDRRVEDEEASETGELLRRGESVEKGTLQWLGHQTFNCLLVFLFIHSPPSPNPFLSIT